MNFVPVAHTTSSLAAGIAYDDLAPLLVRLLEDTGKIPARISLELPRRISLALIYRKLATPTGKLDTTPDLTLDESDIQYLGLPWLANFEAA